MLHEASEYAAHEVFIYASDEVFIHASLYIIGLCDDIMNK